MNQYFHNNASFNPPPQTSTFLPVVEKSKTAYANWVRVHRNMERSSRFGIGTKTDSIFLEVLELERRAMYAPVVKKITILQEIIEEIDSLRFFLQILWELRLIPSDHYASLGSEIETIGRNIGGWKKGLVEKTSAWQKENLAKAEERKE